MAKREIIIIVSTFVVISLICAGLVAGSLYLKNKANQISEPKHEEDILGAQDTLEEITTPEPIPEPEPEPYTGPKIFTGDSRPIAVMIDNETAVTSHAGLNDAYMLYEFIIEGGESRIMAFFKGTNPEKIGPVRSARHYFLDYAMEHDAIFVHFGWSPKAQSDIKTLKINNINGIYDDFYWREAPKSSYHNAFTSMANLLKYAGYKKYRTTSDRGPIIEYNQKDTELNGDNKANEIKIKYSNLQSTRYVYDEESKTYLRYKRDYAHKDRFTGEQFYAKNIIAIYVRDELLEDPENKGRRELYNIGSGDGYYITDGKYIEIKWHKTTRGGRTSYTDLEGNEIKVNDGITWVQIVPVSGNISIN